MTSLLHHFDCRLKRLPEFWFQLQFSSVIYDWRFITNQFVLATSPLRPTTRIFIFQLNTCGYSPYVTSCLTRGWVCRLQLLLGSPAQSFSGPSPTGLMTTFYSLRFETPSTWRAKSPYFYPPRIEWPSDTPGHWVPFSLPFTTRRATVEVFDHASSRDWFQLAWHPRYIASGRNQQKTPSPSLSQQYLSCCLIIRCSGNVFTETLSSNKRLLPAFRRHVTIFRSSVFYPQNTYIYQRQGTILQMICDFWVVPFFICFLNIFIQIILCSLDIKS
jgi:hypothetical protein